MSNSITPEKRVEQYSVPVQENITQENRVNWWKISTNDFFDSYLQTVTTEPQQSNEHQGLVLALNERVDKTITKLEKTIYDRVTDKHLFDATVVDIFANREKTWFGFDLKPNSYGLSVLDMYEYDKGSFDFSKKFWIRDDKYFREELANNKDYPAESKQFAYYSDLVESRDLLKYHAINDDLDVVQEKILHIKRLVLALNNIFTNQLYDQQFVHEIVDRLGGTKQKSRIPSNDTQPHTSGDDMQQLLDWLNADKIEELKKLLNKPE